MGKVSLFSRSLLLLAQEKPSRADAAARQLRDELARDRRATRRLWLLAAIVVSVSAFVQAYLMFRP